MANSLARPTPGEWWGSVSRSERSASERTLSRIGRGVARGPRTIDWGLEYPDLAGGPKSIARTPERQVESQRMASRALARLHVRWFAWLLVMSVLVAGASCGSDPAHDGRPSSGRSGGSESSGSGERLGCERGEHVSDLDFDANGEVEWSLTCWGGDPTSSVSAADLNHDGVMDVVIQGPRRAPDGPPTVQAVDGVSGEEIWRSRSGIYMMTIARFADLNGDGTLDVLLGGRGVPEDERPLLAVDGRTGRELWRVAVQRPAWRNVFTPHPIGDVDGDDIEDWVVVSGGDHIREPLEDPIVSGQVLGISGADGDLIGRLPLPDGQESYSSPVVATGSDGRRTVIVGSGGELLAGSLWRFDLDSILRSDPTGVVRLLSGETSSFIAPASLADLDGDGRIEVVATRLDGLVTAVDPQSGTVRWSTRVGAGSDSSSSRVVSLAVPAIGQLDGDRALEVVVSTSEATEDDLVSGNVSRGAGSLTVLDGQTGSQDYVLEVDSGSSIASPLLGTLADGRAGVICACHQVGETSTYALWVPSHSQVLPLGLPTSLSATPALLERADGSGLRLVSIGAEDARGSASAVVVSSVAIEPGGEVMQSSDWSRYMGRGGPVEDP